MGDLISRQDAIKALYKYRFVSKDVIEREINAIPSARPTGEWIPCEEKLPGENIEVLMSLSWGIDIGEYREDGWHSEWINHYDDDNVIAWMPLPDPYKGGDSE